jgi:hypothetical protein
LDLLAARGAEVDVHRLDRQHLLALAFRQEVGWFGPDHPGPLAALGEHLDPLAEQHVAPPSAEGDEGDRPVVRDRLHHESHLVEVAVEHDPRSIVAAAPFAQQAAQFVVADRARSAEHIAHDPANLVLRTRRTGRETQAT